MNTLYLVSTPIGNLEDISQRALRVLGSAALIAAEDTRHSGRLLKHFGIRTPSISLHDHNENARIPTILAALKTGDVAVISDAGTPLLSDPGYKLVQACIDAGITITPIPGANALLAALVASGLPTDRFLFLGFVARKQKARRAQLQAVAAEPGVLVFYESPRRLATFLADATTQFGPDRPVVIARELTKLHETFWRGQLGTATKVFVTAPRGEIVILIGGAPQEVTTDISPTLMQVMHTLLDAGTSPSETARLLADISGIPRRKLYARVLEAAS